MTLPVLQSPLLAALPEVRHAFFTRKGGVSTGLYGDLNLGPGSRDKSEAVAENRRRAAGHFGVEAEALLSCYQIHSARAFTVSAPWTDARPEGDAVVTATPGLICGALSADCAPVLIADPRARVIAAAHAGWQGALSGIVEAAIEAMTDLGAEPSRMVAAIGPCIGPRSYEVGLEFLDRFEAGRPGSSRFFGPAESAEKRLFDLPAFVLDRLFGAGVSKAEWIGRDTCADEDLFYSNRRAVKRGEGDYGRLLSAITLAP